MSILDLFFPKKCLGCNTLGDYFCSSCIKNLPRVKTQICPGCFNPSLIGKAHPQCKRKTSLDGIVFGFTYEGVIKNAVKKIKYRQIFGITGELVKLSSGSIDSSYFRDFVIIPVPLHRKRQNTRGFNQAEIIGKSLGDYWNLKMDAEILKRVKNTMSQVDLPQKERRENVRGAFALKEGVNVEGKKYLLVDDLFTTGSTLKECTKLLKKAKAKEVWAFAVAHGN